VARSKCVPLLAAHFERVVHAEAIKPTNVLQLIFFLTVDQVAHPSAEVEVCWLKLAGLRLEVNNEEIGVQQVTIAAAKDHHLLL